MTTDPALRRLSGDLNATATGRSLQRGGFVLPVVTTNPLTGIDVPEDGTAVLYQNGTAMTLCCYTRATGWLSRTLV